MDEVVGLLVEQIAKRARDAAAAKAAAAKTPILVPPGAPPRSRPPMGPPPARPAPAPAPPPAAASAPALAPLPSPDAADPFGGTLTLDAPGDIPPPPVAPLVADFGDRNRFLAAFVLSESLAPPVALREPRLP